ncbi:MAG: thiolase C-terminal domain-containing protein [Planctomycetota bacterium]|jgi:acetyl-CoA C-acetyltransferase
MENKVAIVGIGTTGFRATTPDVSYRELTHEAAAKAYLDAGVRPQDIGAFVCTSEDMFEGYSITDEYAPDQVGAVLKSCHSVPGDFIQSLANGVMIILSGYADIVAVQGMSKASNMLTKGDLTTMATDPFLWRPLLESHHALAAMEMNRFLLETGNTREQCAKVVVKNRQNALLNPRAAHGADLAVSNVLCAEPVAEPLTALDIAQHADGAVVCVLARGDLALGMQEDPVWVHGVGWATETTFQEHHDFGEAAYMKLAAEMAFGQAGVRSPRMEIDFAEVNDEYSYKELQHLEALGLCAPGESGSLLDLGLLDATGELPVNVSGGCLGSGMTYELDGGQKVLEVVLQLRGEAGQHQLPEPQVGLAASWRGVPTTPGAVAVLGV